MQFEVDIGQQNSSRQLAKASNFEFVVKNVLASGAKLLKVSSFMKDTDIVGEFHIDVIVFDTESITEPQWNSIVLDIKNRGYVIDSVNPRCIYVSVNKCLVTIEFDVVAKHRRGFPPNKEPENPFWDNKEAVRAVCNIKLDFQDSGEKNFSGNDIEQAVLSQQKTLGPGLEILIDAAKAALKSDKAIQRKRFRTAVHENDASGGNVDWKALVGEGSFWKVYKGQYTVGMHAGQASACKIFKDGTEAYEDQFFDQDVTLCTESIKIADAFNQAKKFGTFVKMCKASVWHMDRSKQRVLVEPFLSNF